MKRKARYSIRFVLLATTVVAVIVAVLWNRYNAVAVPFCSVTDNDAITRLHVRNLLERSGIAHKSIGRGGFLLQRGELRRASELLRQTAEEPDATICLLPGTEPYVLLVIGDKSQSLHRHYEGGIGVGELINDLPIGVAHALTAVASSLKSELGQLPLIVTLTCAERTYMADDKSMRIGYEFEIDVVGEPAAPAMTASFVLQVLDSSQVAFLSAIVASERKQQYSPGGNLLFRKKDGSWRID